jgi:hypothetical protein
VPRQIHVITTRGGDGSPAPEEVDRLYMRPFSSPPPFEAPELGADYSAACCERPDAREPGWGPATKPHRRWLCTSAQGGPRSAPDPTRLTAARTWCLLGTTPLIGNIDTLLSGPGAVVSGPRFGAMRVNYATSTRRMHFSVRPGSRGLAMSSSNKAMAPSSPRRGPLCPSIRAAILSQLGRPAHACPELLAPGVCVG